MENILSMATNSMLYIYNSTWDLLAWKEETRGLLLISYLEVDSVTFTAKGWENILKCHTVSLLWQKLNASLSPTPPQCVHYISEHT